MSKRGNRISPALKHGAYSGTTLLPGEDPVAFERLHNDLISELTPVGCLEEDIVASMAHLVWRKQNLSTYCLTQKVQKWRSVTSLVPSFDFGLGSFDAPKQEQILAAQRASEELLRKELGEAWELTEMGEAATTDHLLVELSIVDRLEGMIDRCLKRLLFVRGLKSISSSSSTTSSPPRNKKLAA
jgi:hypothetical protein